MKAEFRAGANRDIKSDGSYVVVPIFTTDKDDIIKIIGTGFFIATNGMFVTAKHVVYYKEKLIDPLLIFHSLPDNIYVIRNVSNVIIGKQADIAIGLVPPMRNKKTGEDLRAKVMCLTNRKPEMGELISTFAYPTSYINEVEGFSHIHLETTWHFGKIIDHFPDGRDRCLLPGSCFQSSTEILSGASGGPVMDKYGKVCGVNSTGFDVEIDNEPISYFTPIDTLFDFKFYYDSQLIVVKDLVDKKIITVDSI
jgi:hypothetical protein